MKQIKKWFGSLQVIGRSLLLAIACMPPAAIMMSLGQEDLLDLPVLQQAGSAIFGIIPALFAISIAGGIAKDKHVAAGVTAFIILNIFSRILDPMQGSELNAFGLEGLNNVGGNVMMGIIAGILAGKTYERFKDQQLPSVLNFFGGRNFVLIMGCVNAVIMATVLAFVFPYIELAMGWLGYYVAYSGEVGLFFFGMLNRLLIPTGLHHILNSYVYFEMPSIDPVFLKENADVLGEFARFMHGDPSSGTFLAGFFPVMMFGLPAAALAMVHCARKENKAFAKGLLISAAITSFLTGVTEPIEFSFMFVSPILFLVHAIFMGVANVLASLMGAKIVGYSGTGLIDFIIQYPNGTNVGMLLVIGVIMFVAYYFTFRFLITKLDLQTPGREAASEETMNLTMEEKAQKIVDLLGGRGNIVTVDNCITRLRIKLVDNNVMDEKGIKQLGVAGVLKQTDNRAQVVIGADVQNVSNAINAILA